MLQIRIRIINNYLEDTSSRVRLYYKKRVIFTMMVFNHSYNSNYEGEYKLIEPEIIINLSSERRQAFKKRSIRETPQLLEDML